MLGTNAAQLIAPQSLAPADQLVDVPPGLLPRPSKRNESIDVVRFFAAGGVVFVHCAYSSAFDYWGNLFRFAVPFYLFASMYFQARSLQLRPQRSWRSYVLARCVRLYLPFLTWSAIYLVARDIKRIVVEHGGPVPPSTQWLWKGTEYHLWFLPFLLAWSILLATIHHVFLRRSRHFRWPLIAMAIIAGLAVGLANMPAGWSSEFDNPTYAQVQWYYSGPSVLWAMAFAWLLTSGTIVSSVASAVGFAGLAIAAAALMQQVFRGLNVFSRAFSGLGLMLASLAPWHGRAMATLASLGRDGYGIYLCHVLIVEIFHLVTSRLHLGISPGLDVLNFSLSFPGSIVMVRLLARSPKTAWLNG